MSWRTAVRTGWAGGPDLRICCSSEVKSSSARGAAIPPAQDIAPRTLGRRELHGRGSPAGLRHKPNQPARAAPKSRSGLRHSGGSAIVQAAKEASLHASVEALMAEGLPNRGRMSICPASTHDVAYFCDIPHLGAQIGPRFHGCRCLVEIGTDHDFRFNSGSLRDGFSNMKASRAFRTLKILSSAEYRGRMNGEQTVVI